MIRINDLFEKIEELSKRKGLFSIGIAEFFSFIKDIVSKIREIMSNVTLSLVYQPEVATFADLNIKYPNPEVGWTAFVRGNGTRYVWNGSQWVDLETSDWVTKNDLKTALDLKVDKVTGKSLVTDTEITKLSKLPSIDDLNKYLGDKADKVVDKKNVVYATDGDITKEASFLASDVQNGLLSKEQNKFINDLINEYPMIEEVLKPDHEKYLTTVAVGFPEKPTRPFYNAYTILLKTVGTGKVNNVLVETEIKRIVGALDPIYRNIYLNPALIDKKILIRASDLTSIILTEHLVTAGASTLIFQSKDPNLKTLSAAGGYTSYEIISEYLDTLTLSNAKVSELSLAPLKNLKKLTINNSTELLGITHGNTAFEELDFSGCSKFYSMTNVVSAASFPNLITFNISGTAVKPAVLMTVANAWGSRVGKGQGVLTLDQTLYDQLTEEQKAVFTGKNIAFNPVA